MRRYSTLFCLFLQSILSYTQSYKFKKYIEQDGLNNRFVYTIDEDEQGNLMIGTGEGLYTYDGFTFNEISNDQVVSNNFFTCSKSTQDGSIWYGHSNGLLTRYYKNSFEHFDLTSYTHSRVNEIFEDEQKNLWVLTQNDGILRKTADGAWRQFEHGIEDFTLYSITIDRLKNIWLGTDMGLIKATIGQNDELNVEWIDEISETKVASVYNDGESIIVGTEDMGVFQVKPSADAYQITTYTFKGTDLSNLVVNSIFKDGEQNLWIATNNKGLIQLSGEINGVFGKMIRYKDNDQIKTSSIRICRADREGTIWVGTMGDGLLKLTDNYFSIHSYTENKNEASIFSIYEKNDTIWCGGFGEIFISYEEPMNLVDSLSLKEGLPSSEVTALYADEKGSLWVGMLNGQLLRLPKGKRKFVSVQIETEQQQQKINDILGDGNTIYIATDYGIFQYEDDKLIAHISIQSGLSHNVVKSLYRDNRGRIWVATNNSQITYIEDGIIKNLPVPIENALIQIRCITEDNSGNLWIGTDGLGLLKVKNEEVSLFNKYTGLYSDYCYSIVCDHRNKLWVGHHGAISKLNTLSNEIETIDPGKSFEIDFNDNSVERTPSGIILFGINQGVLRYEPNKDQKNEKEPILHFKSISLNDSVYSEFGNINLPYGEYKLEFDFVGVSLKNPNKVSYQYYLEGYENDWCEVTNNHFKDYSKLGSGEYTFRVKCYNSDGYGGTAILEYKIVIDKPFWLKWWFITLCILLLVLTIRFIVLRREKYLREAQERLKLALDERTKEVVEQKELLEEKNKDITDSIQYARNIQRAMLPPIDILKNFFNETLVYYKPRDIVSGDFYWVEKFENTIVVSCADCTGHGVPGAFMSLIGSTLLKEVSGKKHVQCSRDVLLHLDDELRRMLHRQGEVAIQDGMDIVVFDYNVVTRMIKIASANRPVLFFHKGEWLDLKGDRQSIGGAENSTKKDFNQYEFKVEDGDIIYLFSDGITDQFGGDHGKKLKRSGLLAWLKEITHYSMEEQRNILKQNFKNWKGEREQLDDIILLGIKF